MLTINWANPATARTARAGFSLIELVIAILILGIMAATLGPKMFSYIKRARQSATEKTLQAVKSAVNLYHQDTQQYPQRLEDLLVRPAAIPANKWHGPYVGNEKNTDAETASAEDVPKDAWGVELVYTLKPKGSVPPFELYSYGPNKESSDPSEWLHA